MKEMDELIEVAETLMGPEGCFWDKKQTIHSIQAYFLEEAYEVLEAIDSGDQEKIIEELGDLLYVIIFCAKIAEKEKKFLLKDVFLSVKEKLIRRHPHVFGDAKIETIDELSKQWERIKKEEKKEERKSKMDGFPPNYPLIAKAQKMIYRIADHKEFSMETCVDSEEDKWSLELFKIIKKAKEQNIDAESSFRRFLKNGEEKFRLFESTSANPEE